MLRSMKELIEHALANVATKPTVGPRLQGLTLADMAHRVLQESSGERQYNQALARRTSAWEAIEDPEGWLPF